MARSIAPGGPGRERDDGFLAALAGDGQSAVAALGAERLDVSLLPPRREAR
jgi:hypothetical protein